MPADGFPALSPLGRTLCAFKDRRDRYAGRCLGVLFARQIAPLAADADFIVPIASEPARLRERGLGPSAWLARALASESRARFVPRALVCNGQRLPQRRLGGIARRRNAHGAFRMGTTSVAGRTIVLVDDVVTTGATLGEATRVLVEAGAANIRCAVLACADEEILSACRAKTSGAGRSGIANARG